MAAIVGVKGRKYGLQAPRASAAPAAPVSSIFRAAQEEEDEDANQVLAKEQALRSRSKKYEKEMEQVLAQDPSVFAYDEVYDKEAEKRKERVDKKAEEKKDRKPRYMQDILQTTEFRKRENDILWNRAQIKERVKEDHMFEDKEKFVTASYKKQLEEDKVWLAKQTVKDAAEEKKEKNMNSFYAQMLEIRSGGTVPKKEEEEEPKPQSSSSSSSSSSSASSSSSSSASGAGGDSAAVKAERRRSRSRSRSYSRSRSRSPGGRKLSKEAIEYQRKERARIEALRKQEEEEKKRKLHEALKRRHDDVAVDSARERALERKRARLAASIGK